MARYPAWDKHQAQAAMDKAAQEFEDYYNSANDEQRGALDWLAQWWAKWYNGASGMHATGHKLPGRYLVKRAKSETTH